MRIEQTVSCSAPTRASVARWISVTSASTDWGRTGAESSWREAPKIMRYIRSVLAERSSLTSCSRDLR